MIVPLYQQNIWIVTNYGDLRWEFLRHVSFLTVTHSPELSTDLWPPVTSLPASFQALAEPKSNCKIVLYAVCVDR